MPVEIRELVIRTEVVSHQKKRDELWDERIKAKLKSEIVQELSQKLSKKTVIDSFNR